MPLFGESVSPYDESIEKVTAETCTSENWSLIMDICDRVLADQPKGPKMCLLSLKKRLNHRDPHVVLLALSVLDSCWSNCGVTFRREVSSREFSQEMGFKATHSNRAIAEKTRTIIKKWAENECKIDPSLGLIETLYKNLVAEGHSFESDEPKKRAPSSMDANVVESAEEEAAIAKALALSLEESKRTASVHSPSVSSAPARKEKRPERDVRALYDFEAAEDNELTFFAGDIIRVTDDSDVNWWRGRSHRGEGLFPASFVTSDLNVVVPKEENLKTGSQIHTKQKAQVTVTRIDESELLECIRLLEDCDPTGERSDPPELEELEAKSLAQAPLIDARLAEIDKQHNALAQVDIAIRDVLALYDSAVQQQCQMSQPIQQPSVGLPYPTGSVQPAQSLPGQLIQPQGQLQQPWMGVVPSQPNM
ncbi:hypothetical protein AB6A40_004287 [Gnathostoma spinigerum]|uniref:Signal transducing adapter molecule 1 n=1 Tax=Gnathostoma spinigerum TaxID=75299 RepID=A0ABD6EKT4_9BILA